MGQHGQHDTQKSSPSSPRSWCCPGTSSEQAIYKAKKGHANGCGLGGGPECRERHCERNQPLVCIFHFNPSFWILRSLLFILMATTLVGLLPTYAQVTILDLGLVFPPFAWLFFILMINLFKTHF